MNNKSLDFQAYEDWQETPVLTSVRTTGMPISEIEFPAVTICAQGNIQEVYKNFENFQARNADAILSIFYTTQKPPGTFRIDMRSRVRLAARYIMTSS